MVDFTIKLENLKLVADMVGNQVFDYCVLSVFIMFIRGSVPIVKEVQCRPVAGRLVCYFMFYY